MTPENFRASPSEPSDLPPPLRALWQDAAENWKAAHHLVQDDNSTEGAWVHAYLHRKEGDISNAEYWYNRAGKPPQSGDLEAERNAIVASLLEAQGSE